LIVLFLLNIPIVLVSSAKTEPPVEWHSSCPAIKKNLLFVRKLCRDNWVKVEYDDEFMCIKDQTTNEVILTGGIKESPIS